MKGPVVVFVAAMVVLLWIPASSAQQSFVLDPLSRVESETSVRPPRPDGAISPARFVYRNDSDQMITAWRHTCVIATNDAREGWAASSKDAFPSVILDRGGRDRSAEEIGVVPPGGTIEVKVGRGFVKDGPFAIQTCGMTALILADSSHHGAPQELEHLFAQRRAITADIRRIAERLRAVVETTRSNPEDAKALLDEAAGVGFYHHALTELREEQERGGRPPLAGVERLLQRAEKEYDTALAHLRPVDRELLGATR